MANANVHRKTLISDVLSNTYDPGNERVRGCADRRGANRENAVGFDRRAISYQTIQMHLDFITSAVVTLLVVVDPVGLAPIFIGVTYGLPSASRRAVALRACLIAGGILIGTALAGESLLRRLGISLSAFEISGGLLLFWIAAEMVYGTRGERESKAAEQVVEEHIRIIAAFPLAIPLMAGPGAIAATVLLAGQAHEPSMFAALIGVIVAVCAATFVVFLFASSIRRVLGTTGNIVLSRLLGVILAALSVQYVIDGVHLALKAGG